MTGQTFRRTLTPTVDKAERGRAENQNGLQKFVRRDDFFVGKVANGERERGRADCEKDRDKHAEGQVSLRKSSLNAWALRRTCETLHRVLCDGCCCDEIRGGARKSLD